MSLIRVTCPTCSLEKVYEEHGILPADWKTEDGNLLCPNCNVPMKPVGESHTMRAEHAFKEANAQLREAQTTSAPVETEETLRKRLAEIRDANLEVGARARVLEEAKKEAQEARKAYDAAVERLRTVTERLTRVPTADAPDLPLFTPAAEAAAADVVSVVAVDVTLEGVDETLLEKLAEAGVDVDSDAIREWTPDQRSEAWVWATNDGTVDGMPPFVASASQEAAEEPEEGSAATP